MKRVFSILAGLLFVVWLGGAAPALAQGESQSTMSTGVRSWIAPLRLIPVAGAASFSNQGSLNLGNFDRGFAAGIYGDYGDGPWNFESGLISLNSRSDDQGEGARTFTVNSWGIPILAKYHFGNPHQSFFVKAGGMPFSATGSANEMNVMGVAGVGGHIPLGLNSSLVIEGTYNRLFNNNGGLTNYQGVALLGGIALNI
jgi:hypothetical protein